MVASGKNIGDKATWEVICFGRQVAMKWLFRAIFLTLAVFILVMIAGAFQSADLQIEREVGIDAAHEDVFFYVNDLSVHPEWSPWLRNVAASQIVYGGPASGVGQTMAWKADSGDIGSQTILESVDGAYMRADLIAQGQTALVTYAITDDGEGAVLVLLSAETSLGGFPYVQRLFKGRYAAQWGQKMEGGLVTLKGLVETEMTQDF